MSGASGRLWLTNDGRGRIELQSDAGDVQIVWNQRRRSRSTTPRRTRSTARRFPAQQRVPGTATDTPPTLAEIDTFLAELGVHWALSGAQPTDVAGQPAYSVSASRRSTTAACSARSSSPGTPRTACRSASAIYAQGSSIAGARARGHGHLLRRRRRRATSTSRRRRARRSSTSAPAVDAATRLEHAGGDRARRGHRRPPLPGRRARHARRPAAPGRAARRRRHRARRSTARGSAGSRSSSARPTRRGDAASALSGLPTVSLDGLTAHELATQLGTVLEWQSRRHELRPRRLAAARRGRGGGAGGEVSDAPPVEARGLVKRYGEIVAVDHVDLTVERGDVFGYLGPNGAGKTTSLRMLLGLIRPTEGSARLFGRDPLVDGAKALDGVAGFVEGAALLPVPLRAAATCGCSPTTTSRSRARASTRCSSSSSCATGRRTGSAATRTGCASGSASPRRSCAQPRLLLLDEPTTGLDPAGMRDMRELVRRLAGEGITILLSSHLLDEVEELCNRVAIIRKGRDHLPGRAARPARDGGERLPAARRSSRSGRARRCSPSRGSSDVELRDGELRFTADEDAVAALIDRARPGAGSRSPRSCRRRRASRSSSSA